MFSIQLHLRVFHAHFVRISPQRGIIPIPGSFSDVAQVEVSFQYPDRYHSNTCQFCRSIFPILLHLGLVRTRETSLVRARETWQIINVSKPAALASLCSGKNTHLPNMFFLACYKTIHMCKHTAMHYYFLEPYRTSPLYSQEDAPRPPVGYL